jgi:hypothetical protein
MPRTCFVIGPIGSAGSPIRQHADDLIKYIIRPCLALPEFDYEAPIRADKLGEPGRITTQIIKLLKDADLVIADLTSNNANVYYELSIRHAMGGRAIHMALDDTSISFDLHDNRTIFFNMHSRIAENARTELTDQIRRVHEEGYKSFNPIVEAIGIINLERSTDPNQKVLAQLLSSVEFLTGEVRSVQSALRVLQMDELRQANALDLYARSNVLNVAANALTAPAGPTASWGGLAALGRQNANALVDVPAGPTGAAGPTKKASPRS